MTDTLDHLDLLRALVDRGASDLHCKAGSVPVFRVAGSLERHGETPFTAGTVLRAAQAMLTEEQHATLERSGTVVGVYSAPGVGRFRVAVFRQRGAASIVIHAVPHEVRALESLELPEAALHLAGMDRGLVLVASPAGNGASTTLAALVDHVNRNRRRHVVTVEDPIEVLHRDEQSIVSQLEVGSDAPSIAEGIRTATRLDADVIAVSGIFNREVAAGVLDAVGRGHLVIGAIGGETVPQVVNGFLELFAFEERPAFRQSLARSLAGMLVQRLLVGTRGELVLVAESLVKTARIEQVLATDATLRELPELLREGGFHGMQTLDQSLRDRVRDGRLDEAVALAASVQPEELRIELLRS